MVDGARTWKIDSRMTQVALPAGATDCHCHVFGPTDRFSYAADSKFRPGEAPKEALFALHDRMGIQRCVIVQSGCHGFDNRVVADAIAARPGRYLGVALTAPDVTGSDLDALAAQGFRGVRFNYMRHLAPGADPAQLRALAPRLAARELHLQVHMQSSMIAEMTPTLVDLPVNVVIDHFGRVDASKGADHGDFQALLKLMDHERVW